MNIKFDFSGKNFLVTGASSGIGYQTALELLIAGANVLGIARRADQCFELKTQFPERWHPACVDVTRFDLVENAVKTFVAEKGKIHGCVHSAGIGALLPINVWNIQKAREIMDVNLWAGEALLQLLLKKKYHQDELSHVCISSVSAQKGQKGLSIYAASKGALESMVRCAARELAGKKQRINSVCLGWIDTGLTQNTDNVIPENLLGIGNPEDAAGMILFLLSDRSRWITGSNFVIDGGYLA